MELRLPVKSYFQNKWTLDSMANAFILAVIMIKGKSLYDGFSYFNSNEVKMNGLDVQLSWSSKR